MSRALELHPWPVAPRPFLDEPLGGWLGRVAARYRMGVEQLAAEQGLQIEAGEGGGTWLLWPGQRSETLQHLAALARLDMTQLERLQIPQAWSSDGNRFLPYCHRCLVLNPQDVSAPYWRRQWLDPQGAVCSEHAEPMRHVRRSALQRCRNFNDILPNIERAKRYAVSPFYSPAGHRAWWQP